MQPRNVVLGGLGALLLASASLVLGARSTAAQSPRLFGTLGYGYGQTSTLVEIDAAAGAIVQTIGPVGFLVNGMCYDRSTGKMYGSTSVNDPVYNGLIEIDVSTGAGTAVGVHEWGLSGYYKAVTNITTDSSGQMYGWWDPNEDDLVRIDKTTGIATRVGESGVGTAENGLAFDSSDTLYMVNTGGRVYTVDTTTGAATYQGSIGTTAHHGDIHPVTGLWYGLTWQYGYPRDLIAADLGAFTASVIGPVGDMHTLAFMQVPTAHAVGGTGVGDISVGVDETLAVRAIDGSRGRPWLVMLLLGSALSGGAAWVVRRLN